MRQIIREQTRDGFLDFKIFVRLIILELKMIVFPSLPTSKKPLGSTKNALSKSLTSALSIEQRWKMLEQDDGENQDAADKNLPSLSYTSNAINQDSGINFSKLDR